MGRASKRAEAWVSAWSEEGRLGTGCREAAIGRDQTAGQKKQQAAAAAPAHMREQALQEQGQRNCLPHERRSTL